MNFKKLKLFSPSFVNKKKQKEISMKKIITFLVLITASMSLIGCDLQNDNESNASVEREVSALKNVSTLKISN